MKSIMISVALANIVTASVSLLAGEYLYALTFAAMSLMFAIAIAFDAKEV
jgi:hypothetical protein